MSKERPTYPLLIEESSNYAFTVRRIAKPLSFDKLRNTSNRFYNDLPEEIRDELHNSILHGTCMLSSEPELNAYMHDMGKMHNAKLRKAYENLPGGIWSYCDMFGTEEVKCIDIIDYGCGQGLGIICFADIRLLTGESDLCFSLFRFIRYTFFCNRKTDCLSCKRNFCRTLWKTRRSAKNLRCP